jgi:hypothetical protein
MPSSQLVVYSKVIDITVVVLLAVFFVSLLAFDYALFGLNESPIHIPHELELYFEQIPWIVFGLLLVDIYIKYLKVGSLKALVKNHWLDIIMTALIPILMPLKFMKAAFKLFKAIKATKSGFKMAQKIKKIVAHFKSEH